MSRILHISKYYPPVTGGVESFVHDLAHAQARAGNRVGVVAHGSQTRRRRDGPVEIFEIKAYGQLLYAPVSPNWPKSFAKAIAAFNPDLLHFHMPNPSAFCALSLPRARNLPWVIQWQSDVVANPRTHRFLWLLYHAYRPLENAMLRRARILIASSEEYRSQSLPLAPYRNKTKIVPLGIEPARLQDKQQPGIDLADDRTTLNVLVLGRLAHYKGHAVLLQALKQCADIHAVLVGRGELERSLRKMARSLGIAARVTFAGSLPQEEVNWLLDNTDVLCLPSTARSESFGLVLLEAMAAGLPVIASDLKGSGMRWIVNTAGNGLLVAPGDVRDLTKALESMKDARLRERFSDTGRIAFTQQFHIDRIAAQIGKLYTEAGRITNHA